MLIPTTDKWVLVRWHGGVRSVVLRKFLCKHLPPGEQLKISAVVKVATSEAGKPDTATVLTSGNDRHQLDLLSDPGERTASSDDEQPQPEPDNDLNEESGEDFEESSSDWTPDGPSTEESDSSESDIEKDTNKKDTRKKETSRRIKSVSKPSPKKSQNTKKSSESFEDEAARLKTKEVLAKTLEQLENLYLGPDRKMDRIKKRREQPLKGETNDKERKQKAKGRGDSKSMPEVLTYMHAMFASLYQVIVSTDQSVQCPAEFEHVKVGVVAETGDVVIRDKKYYNTIQRLNQQTSEYFDKTLTPHETDYASTPEPVKKNKKKSQVFDKTLTPHESDDEPLATIVKKNTKAPNKTKKTPELVKNKKTMKLLDNNRTSTPVENNKLAEASTDDDSSDCDYSSDRSDDPVLISNKYETVETNHSKPEAEWIPIGSGTTLIHKDKFLQVNWKSYTKATRTLLTAAFSRRTLATHSLTGKKSPAFSHKPAKMCLDPKIVSDIVIEVGDKFKIRDNLVRNIITTKCADECKMRKLKKAKKMKAKLAQAANETNDVENNNQENVPTPKKTPKASKKNNRKSTPPKTRNTSVTGGNNNKTPKKVEKKAQENVMPPENDTNKIHPNKEENLPLVENKTKSTQNEKEEDILSSDDETAMVIDEDYRPPSENSVLKSIDNKRQENILPAENTENNEEYKPSVHMSMRSKNRDNITAPENNTSKSIKNKNQENIPPPVKKNVKGYKTYKNKCKTK